MTLSFLERLRPRREAPALPRFEGLAQVRAYWEALRTAGMLPDRRAIDPRGLNGMLDRIFLAEYIGKGHMQMRVAGSGLTEFAGDDIRGLPLSCLFTPESRPLLAQTLQTVIETPAVAELDLGSDRRGGAMPFARMLLLPLADPGGSGLVLGAVSFSGGMAACKLQIQSRREETLQIPPTLDVQAPDLQLIRRYGHLALVHTSD
jgi:hypothetical protein